MALRPFIIRLFNLIGTFFGIVGFVGFGFVLFKTIVLWPFIAQTVNQRQIVPQPVELQQLSSVRPLVGSWVGKATFRRVNENVNAGCDFKGDATLQIRTQNDDDSIPAASFGLAYQLVGACGAAGAISNPWTDVVVTGQATGTRIEIRSPAFGTFSGSFTTDTMTLNRTADGTAWTMTTAPLNLLKQ